MTDATNHAARSPIPLADYSRRAALNQAIHQFVEERRRPNHNLGDAGGIGGSALDVGSLAERDGRGKSGDRSGLGPVADRIMTYACWGGWVVLGASLAHVAWLAVLKI